MPFLPFSPAMDADPKKSHVLIADDRPDELRLLVGLLRAEKFRISVAFDGHQAHSRAVVALPDLILMDVHMPRLDGFAACRLLRATPQTAHIPIIFLTSKASLSDRLEGLRNGGVDYIIKPFDAAEVIARIHIHLPQRLDAGTADAASLDALGSEDAMLVRAATSYLLAHLAHPPSVAGLAQRVGTYEKKVAQAFRNVLGKTVFEFVREERLRLAARLLRESSMSIGDIAAEVGFSSAANFGTAFRLHVGLTPSAFREQSRPPPGV
ncbi:MAG: response regulator [Janthinobacterium lividum]